MLPAIRSLFLIISFREKENISLPYTIIIIIQYLQSFVPKSNMLPPLYHSSPLFPILIDLKINY